MLICYGYHIFTITDGEPTYPDTVSVYSRGGAADSQPQSLGVYEKTTLTWSGIAVWQSTDDKTFLYYDGNK